MSFFFDILHEERLNFIAKVFFLPEYDCSLFSRQSFCKLLIRSLILNVYLFYHSEDIILPSFKSLQYFPLYSNVNFSSLIIIVQKHTSSLIRKY